MSLRNRITTQLMPISLAASWYAFLVNKDKMSSSELLKTTIAPISGFYMSWALFKKYYEKKEEIGQYTMGLLLATSLAGNRKLSAGAVGVVLANYLLGVYLTQKSSAEEMAVQAKRSEIWAYTLKAYMFANLGFWGHVLSVLLKSDDSDSKGGNAE